jgi:hypothetical protein
LLLGLLLLQLCLHVRDSLSDTRLIRLHLSQLIGELIRSLFERLKFAHLLQLLHDVRRGLNRHHRLQSGIVLSPQRTILIVPVTHMYIQIRQLLLQ